SALPNLRAVLSGGKVAAIVVASQGPAPTPPARRAIECNRPASTERSIGACLTAAGEQLELGTDEVVIRTADGERTLATSPRFPGLVFAAPLRSASDGRDELIVITRTDDAALRSWWIVGYRLEGTRLVRSVDSTQLYELSIANARWIGADLHDVELYLELTSRPDGIEVGGLLTTPAAPKKPTRIHDVVVISPASVTRHRGKLTSAEPSDAGVPGSAATARVIADAAADAAAPPAAASTGGAAGASSGTDSDLARP
ncbi:MAG TPA: hypothetical protein VFK02_08850, partial [Kofleriaceae bacterium]|nr:hypothetical protein [Kofleriaceae bacterium]